MANQQLATTDLKQGAGRQSNLITASMALEGNVLRALLQADTLDSGMKKCSCQASEAEDGVRDRSFIRFQVQKYIQPPHLKPPLPKQLLPFVEIHGQLGLKTGTKVQCTIHTYKILNTYSVCLDIRYHSNAMFGTDQYHDIGLLLLEEGKDNRLQVLYPKAFISAPRALSGTLFIAS